MAVIPLKTSAASLSLVVRDVGMGRPCCGSDGVEPLLWKGYADQ